MAKPIYFIYGETFEYFLSLYLLGPENLQHFSDDSAFETISAALQL